MSTYAKDFWYSVKDKDLAGDRMIEQCRSIEEIQREKHEQNLLHARLYANKEMLGLDWSYGTGEGGTHSTQTYRWTSENVTQSVVDTAQALIAKQRPRCAVLTTGASFTLARQAEQLDQFLYADMKRAGVYQKAPIVFRDCEIFGDGIMKIYACENSGKVEYERTCVDEIIVDERDCISDSQPSQMFQRRPVSCVKVQQRWPQVTDEDIAKALDDDGSPRWTVYRAIPDHMVMLVEGWYIDSNGKGRHMIAIRGKVIVDEVYGHQDFPFAVIKWTDPLSGWYGRGLVEQGAGIQLRINKTNRHIDRCLDLMANPKWIVPLGSRLKPSDITDNIGDILQYAGQVKPDIWVGNPVGNEVFGRLASLKQSYYELAGISMLSATSQKPAGLESGAALREYNDRETDRFAIPSQKYEDFFMRMGELHIRCARELGKGYKSRGQSWKDGNLQRTIKWGDVDIEDDRFELSIEAASILSKTPAGRKSDVMDLINAGWISPAEAPSLLGNPDIDKWRELREADYKDADYTAQRLMDGEIVIPEDHQNLELCAAHIQRTWLVTRRMEGVPEEILDNMLDFVERCREMLQAKQEAEMLQMAEAQAQAQMENAAPGPEQPVIPSAQGVE